MNVKDVSEEEKLDFIKRHVGEFHDYPKKGILFRDIFTALCDATVCKYIKELLVARVKEHIPDVEFIVGLEARGFLFNLLLAAELGVGCASIRKRGKLPGECMAVEYSLEYGTDIFELQKIAITPGMKIVVIDDLIATGGTLTAAVNLIRSLGGNVIACMVVMELESLRGREQLDCNVHSLIKY